MLLESLRVGSRTARRSGARRRTGAWACFSRPTGRRITSRSATPSPVWTDHGETFPPAGAAVSEGIFRRQKNQARDDLRDGAGHLRTLPERPARGRRGFAPGWTDYHQRAYYNTYDVTSLSEAGRQRPGCLGGAMAGIPATSVLVCCAGSARSTSGAIPMAKRPRSWRNWKSNTPTARAKRSSTDKSWKDTGDGPIREGDFLMGEYYDARKEMPGWYATWFR